MINLENNGKQQTSKKKL